MTDLLHQEMDVMRTAKKKKVGNVSPSLRFQGEPLIVLKPLIVVMGLRKLLNNVTMGLL